MGRRPVSVAVADLDGDGVADVVTANYEGGDVSVLLGNGDGSFQAAASFATGEATNSIAVADFDGDGVPDLVTASYYSGGVSLLLGNGDGSFQAAVPFAVPNGPNFVAVGDFDGDGAPDLVTADGPEVSVLLGNGDGSFGAAVSFAAGDGAVSVAVADFDGDGIPDLVTPNADDGGVNVLLGNGDGSFQAPNFFAAGDFPVAVAAPDLDGDGVPDLVTANSGLYWPSDGDVSVLLGNGDGSFGAAVSFAAGDTPVSVAVADLDGDGVPDVVTANRYGGDVSVLLGNGDGSFQAAASFAAGSAPVSVAVADLDGDGVPDVVTADRYSDGVIVLLGNGDRSFAAAMPFAAGDDPVHVAVADLDGDGVPDLVTANPNLLSSSSGYVTVLLGNGDGSFQVPNFFAAGGDPFSVAVADLDSDDIPDIVTANPNVVSPSSGDLSVLLGNGDGSFQTAVSVAAGEGPAFVTAADLDGDGVPDLVALSIDDGDGSVRVLLGNGDGSFQAAVSIAEGDFPTSVAVADLDSDRVPDLVISYPYSDAVSVRLGNGDGSFQDAVFFAVGPFPFQVTAADLDGDGAPDLVNANADAVGVSVLLGNGDGSFQAAIPVPESSGPRFVTVADLDGDGVPDLVTADPRRVDGSGRFVEPKLSVLLGNGDASFQPAIDFAAGDRPAFVAVADLDGDGALDLVITDQFDVNQTSNIVTVLINLCAPAVRPAIDIKPGSDTNSIHLANRSAIPVAILGSAVFDATEVDAASLAFGPGGARPTHPRARHLEDVNADGALDLVAHFRAEETGIAFGDRAACLTGETFDGQRFEDCDGIRTVPDKNSD